MRMRYLLFPLLVISMLFPGLDARAEAPTPPTEWGEFLRLGIEWRLFHIDSPRPNDIYVARMWRSTTNATIDTAVAGGTLVGDGPEAVPDMAARYNGAINYWGKEEMISQTLTMVPAWGGRNDVAVAINGYFFDQQTGVPWSGVVHSGWFDKLYTKNLGDAGFAFTSDRRAFIGSCVYYKKDGKNEVNFENTNITPNLDGVNLVRESEQFILYTPQYSSNTGTENGVLELLVESEAPSGIKPSPGTMGILRRISNKGSMQIPFNSVVLSFWDDRRDTVQSYIDAGQIKVGDRVGIVQQITDCDAVPEKNWNGIYAGLGGDYHFLNDGVYTAPDNNDANVPNSRTVVAFNDEFVYFIVVDGWRKDSQGLSIWELTDDFLTSSDYDIQATDAVSLDSGGSSTFSVFGAIQNDTYCNYTRKCNWPPPEQAATPAASQTPFTPYTPPVIEACEPGNCKPLVGSSLMMISSVSVSQSSTFTPTQEINTTTNAEVRLGPGTNYASTGTAPSGTRGEVLAQMNGINGVKATGSYWWYVDIGDLAGWVQEEQLQGGSLPPPPIAFTDFIFLPTMTSKSAVVSSTSAPSPPDVGRR